MNYCHPTKTLEKKKRLFAVVFLSQEENIQFGRIPILLVFCPPKPSAFPGETCQAWHWGLWNARLTLGCFTSQKLRFLEFLNFCLPNYITILPHITIEVLRISWISLSTWRIPSPSDPVLIAPMLVPRPPGGQSELRSEYECKLVCIT